MTIRTGKNAAMYLEATATKMNWATLKERVVAIPKAALGSSMSIKRRSWEKRLTVIPLSTLAWNDKGAFETVSSN